MRYFACHCGHGTRSLIGTAFTKQHGTDTLLFNSLESPEEGYYWEAMTCEAQAYVAAYYVGASARPHGAALPEYLYD